MGVNHVAVVLVLTLKSCRQRFETLDVAEHMK